MRNYQIMYYTGALFLLLVSFIRIAVAMWESKKEGI